MKNVLLIALVALLSFTSCSKDDCEKNNTGSIKVNNQTPATGAIYAENVYKGDIAAFGTLIIENVGAGNVLVRFDYGALTRTASVNVLSCQESVSNIN